MILYAGVYSLTTLSAFTCSIRKSRDLELKSPIIVKIIEWVFMIYGGCFYLFKWNQA